MNARERKVFPALPRAAGWPLPTLQQPLPTCNQPQTPLMSIIFTYLLY